MRWEEIPETVRKGALLLGNGASRAVWEDFRYGSLFEEARRPGASSLNAESQGLFSAFETTNFERVLNALTLTKIVNSSLGVRTDPVIEGAYENTREALIRAVHAVHVPWAKVDESAIHRRIGEYLRNHSYVFTTNYDLLLYWSMMAGGNNNEFRDFFWNNPFDLTKVFFDIERTNIWFLHGALHLYRGIDGATHKRLWRQGENLIDTFEESFVDNRTPLFVSEGSWQEKLESIRESDYLSFALRALAEFEGPIVVFGHSLTPDYDNHVIGALRPQTRPREFAVSVLPGDEETVAAIQTEILQRLPRQRIWFFDSTTHPLGMQNLQLWRPPPAEPLV